MALTNNEKEPLLVGRAVKVPPSVRSQYGSLYHPTTNTISPNTPLKKSRRRRPYHLTVDLASRKNYMRDERGRHYYDTYHRYRYYQKLAKSFHLPDNINDSSSTQSTPYNHPHFHIIPDHVIPPELFLVADPSWLSSSLFKRLVTIFSLWNTMVGSGTLAMPWAFSQAGYIGGTICIVSFGCLAFFTCFLMLRTSYRLKLHLGTEELPDFCDVCGHYMGLAWGYRSSLIVSVFLLAAASIVFWILMTSYLYDTLVYFLTLPATPKSILSGPWDDSRLAAIQNLSCPNIYACPVDHKSDINVKNVLPTWWDKRGTVPLFLMIAVFPLINFRSPKFFSRLNCLGTISVLTLCSFVTLKIYQCSRFVSEDRPIHESTSLRPFSLDFPKLTGILALALLIHNAFIPILNMNPTRSLPSLTLDLGTAYALATLTYLYVGATFYAGFVGLAGGGGGSIPKGCPLSDNFLDNVPARDGFTAAVRALLLFQMMTVFPLVAYLLRLQVCSLVASKDTDNRQLEVLIPPSHVDTPFEPLVGRPFDITYPVYRDNPPPASSSSSRDIGRANGHTYLRILALNIVLVSVCVVFAIYLPHIGLILRFAGGFCGFVYVFFLPPFVWAASLRDGNKLSPPKLILILCLVSLGCANFVSQFFYS